MKMTEPPFQYPGSLLTSLVIGGVLSILPLLSFTTPARAEVELSAGHGVMTGYTQYEVGAPVYPAGSSSMTHYPFSRLKFPIDAVMFKGTARISFGDNWQVESSVATNISEETGDMKDYDWLHSGNPEQLDIYSESDTEMRTLLMDGKVSYRILQKTLPGGEDTSGSQPGELIGRIGVGFRYQFFDFDVSDTVQWDDVSGTPTVSRYSGKTMTYEAEYLIPYLHAGVALNLPPRFSLDAGLAWAPVINFRDWDNHLLRDKTQDADHNWNGSAFFATASCRYDLSRNWFVKADLEAAFLESEGRAVQSTGQSVRHEVESRQTSAYLLVGYRF